MSNKINDNLNFDYEMIERDYYPCSMTDDDDRVYRAKEALSLLSPAEKKIFLTYVELGTYSATARVFHVSPPTIRQYVSKVLIKLKEHLNDIS